MTSNPNDLDIWGEPPAGEKKDCFYCGLMYYVHDSDAPEEYQPTYCSLHCYSEDMRQLKAEQRLDAQLDSGREAAKPFRLKIKQED